MVTNKTAQIPFCGIIIVLPAIALIKRRKRNKANKIRHGTEQGAANVVTYISANL